jgi:hypothetical protein
MLSVVECNYTEYYHAECHFIIPSTIVLHVISQSVAFLNCHAGLY